MRGSPARRENHRRKKLKIDDVRSRMDASFVVRTKRIDKSPCLAMLDLEGASSRHFSHHPSSNATILFASV